MCNRYRPASVARIRDVFGFTYIESGPDLRYNTAGIGPQQAGPFVRPAGWIDVDLETYHLHLSTGQSVAAGIQWLQGQQLSPDKNRFGGPGAFPSPRHRALARDKSEARWRVFPINVSMYLAVQTYK